jgi:hypothetical protein
LDSADGPIYAARLTLVRSVAQPTSGSEGPNRIRAEMVVGGSLTNCSRRVHFFARFPRIFATLTESTILSATVRTLAQIF